MTDEESKYREEFLRLTEREPLEWQWRLFRDYFATGNPRSLTCGRACGHCVHLADAIR